MELPEQELRGDWRRGGGPSSICLACDEPSPTWKIELVFTYHDGHKSLDVMYAHEICRAEVESIVSTWVQCSFS